MLEDEANTRLGTLLERAGLVTSGDIAEAVAVSKRLQTPIGRVLIMSGCVSERTLSAALEAQNMLRDRHINLEAAIEALVRVAQEKIPLKDALVKTDKIPQPGTSTNKLGEILMEFGLINKSTLDAALQTSAETGMPLGSSLVCLGAISPSLLPLLLRTQEQIRDGTITRQEAVNEFREAYAMWTKAKESVKRGDLDSGLQGGKPVAQRAPEPAPIVASSYQDYYRKLAAQSFPNRQTGESHQQHKPAGYQQTPAEFANYQPKTHVTRATNASTRLPAVNPAATTVEPSLPPPGSDPQAQPWQAAPPSAQQANREWATSTPPSPVVQPQMPTYQQAGSSPQAASWPSPSGYDNDPRATQQQAPSVQGPADQAPQIELSWPSQPPASAGDPRSAPTARHTDVAMPAFERAAAKQQHTGSLYSPQSTSFDMPAAPGAEAPGVASPQEAPARPHVVGYEPAPIPADVMAAISAPINPDALSSAVAPGQETAHDKPATLKRNGSKDNHPEAPQQVDQHTVRSMPLPANVLAAISSATKSASVDPLVMPSSSEDDLEDKQAAARDTAKPVDSITIDPSTTTIASVETAEQPEAASLPEQPLQPTIPAELPASSPAPEQPSAVLSEEAQEVAVPEVQSAASPVIHEEAQEVAVPEVQSAASPIIHEEAREVESAASPIIHDETKEVAAPEVQSAASPVIHDETQEVAAPEVQSAASPVIQEEAQEIPAPEEQPAVAGVEPARAVIPWDQPASASLDQEASHLTPPDLGASQPVVQEEPLVLSEQSVSMSSLDPQPAPVIPWGESASPVSLHQAPEVSIPLEQPSSPANLEQNPGAVIPWDQPALPDLELALDSKQLAASIEAEISQLAQQSPEAVSEVVLSSSELPLQAELPSQPADPLSTTPATLARELEPWPAKLPESKAASEAEPPESKAAVEPFADQVVFPPSDAVELPSTIEPATISELEETNANDSNELLYDDLKPDGKKRKKSDKTKGSSKSKHKKSMSNLEAANIVSLVEVLKLGGCFTQKELLTAFTNSLEHPTKSIELLFAIGLVDEKLLSGAKRCQSMMQDGSLKPQQAAYVLSSMRSGRMTLESALEEVSSKPS